MTQNTRRVLLPSSAITLLAIFAAGCGGTGGDKNATTNHPANSAPTTEESATTTIASTSLQLETVALMTGSTSGDPTSLEGVIEAQQVAEFATADFTGLALTTTTVFCGTDPAVDTGNGSITTARDDVDPPGTSTGDSVTVTFTNCNQFGRVIAGSRSYTVKTASGTPGAGAFTLDTTRTADVTSTSTRGARKDVSTANTTIGDTGTVLSVVSSGTSNNTFTPTGGVADTRTATFNTDSKQDQTTQTFTRSFKSSSQSTAGGTNSIETTTPLSGTIGSAPTAGVIRISATDPVTNVTRITTITALPGDLVRIDVDQNGDGVIDSTTETSWSGIIGIGLGGGFGGGFGGGGVVTRPSVPGGGTGGTLPPVGTSPGGGFFGGGFGGGGARAGIGLVAGR